VKRLGRRVEGKNGRFEDCFAAFIGAIMIPLLIFLIIAASKD